MKRISGALHPDLGADIEAEVRRRSEQRWRTERAGRDDARVPEQAISDERRMAEALGDICGRSQGADVRDGRRVRPRTGVTMTLDQLLGTDNSPAERPDGSPVPAAVARKMACAGGIVPIVLGGESIPLDWGRARRFAAPQQVDALLLQYPTCTLFGCTFRAEWCDAHHIQPFDTGGPTDLANLTFACDHCHDLVHRNGWGVRKEPDGTVTSWAPDGRTWTVQPRRRAQPPGRRRRPQPQPAAAPETYDQPALV